jgi:hypothetical protein
LIDEPDPPDQADDQAAAAQEWAEQLAMEQARVDKAWGESAYTLTEDSD